MIKARRIQPEASSAAAAEIVSDPMRVRLMLSSSMMRPRIGMAVIDIAVAMNKEKFSQLPFSPKAACIQRPRNNPRLKGNAIPATETEMAVRPFFER